MAGGQWYILEKREGLTSDYYHPPFHEVAQIRVFLCCCLYMGFFHLQEYDYVLVYGPMLHGEPPPKKNMCTRHSRVPGTWGPLGNLPKLSGTPLGTRGLVGRLQDIPDRFQRCSGQISRML
jgi:hypothetical protein